MVGKANHEDNNGEAGTLKDASSHVGLTALGAGL
jgi:hypothetical protein